MAQNPQYSGTVSQRGQGDCARQAKRPFIKRPCAIRHQRFVEVFAKSDHLFYAGNRCLAGGKSLFRFVDAWRETFFHGLRARLRVCGSLSDPYIGREQRASLESEPCLIPK